MAGLAQPARASAVGQRATQHGEASRGSQISQNGDLLLGGRCQRAALAPPETAMDGEEHSGGALRGSTHEDSGGALWRGTQEDSGGALRRGTQEEHSGGCPASSPATLSWAFGPPLPASEFEGLAPFDRLTDRPCVPCPPWRPCHPIAQQRQVTSAQRLASTRTSIPRAFSAASQV